MGAVDLTKHKVGGAITHTALNADLQEWNTESTAVDGENVRDEGVDRRNFDSANRPAMEPPSATGQRFTQDGSLTIASATEVVAYSIGPYDLYTTNSERGWRVVFTAEYEAEAGDATDSVTVHFRLHYKTTLGGAWVALTGTHRKLRFGAKDILMRGSLRITKDVMPQLVAAGVNSNDCYIGCAIWESTAGGVGGGNVDVSDVSFYLVRHTH